jgi:hypothetical protein
VSSASDSPKSPRKDNIQRIRYCDRHVKKDKEPKCWTCGSQPWRVKGIKCKGSVKVDVPLIDEEGNVEYIIEKRPCGLRFAEEGPIEIPFNPLKSYLGVDDK